MCSRMKAVALPLLNCPTGAPPPPPHHRRTTAIPPPQRAQGLLPPAQHPPDPPPMVRCRPLTARPRAPAHARPRARACAERAGVDRGAARAELAGYADADVVKVFEQRTGARVEVTLVDADEMLRERISTRDAADFDVFAVNTAELQRYIDRGLVVPLALDALPNRGAQLARFRDPAALPGVTRRRGVRRALCLRRDGVDLRPPPVRHALRSRSPRCGTRAIRARC